MDYYKRAYFANPNSSPDDQQTEPYLVDNQRIVNEDYWPSDNYDDANNLPSGQQDESTIAFGKLSESGKPNPTMSQFPCFSYRSNIGGRF